MNILNRMKRVTTARLEVVLSRAENPETVLPQLIREMEDQVREATQAEAQALAAARSQSRTAAQLREKHERLGAGAASAVTQGDEALAREALAAQLQLERDLELAETAAATAAEQQVMATAAREEVQAQLREVRAKKDELLTRARVLKSQERIQRTLSGPVTSGNGSILDMVAALETKVEEQEARLAVRREMTQAGSTAGSPSLQRRLDALGKDAEIDRRLAALKETQAEKV